MVSLQSNCTTGLPGVVECRASASLDCTSLLMMDSASGCW